MLIKIRFNKKKPYVQNNRGISPLLHPPTILLHGDALLRSSNNSPS